jgi:predicted Zn-dependent protease
MRGEATAAVWLDRRKKEANRPVAGPGSRPKPCLPFDPMSKLDKALARSAPFFLVVATAACAHEHAEQVAPLPRDEQILLGARIDQAVHEQARMLPDPVVREYAERIGRRLAAVARDQPGAPVRIEVVDNPSRVGAFSSPSGAVFVFSGTLLMVGNEAELAALLAHELAHRERGDVTRELTALYGVPALGEAAAGHSPGLVTEIARRLLGFGIAVVHPVAAERAVDQRCLRMLTLAGYDPHALLSLYRRISGLSRRRSETVARFLATHRPPQDREDYLTHALALLGSPRGRTGERVLARVARRMRVYYATLGLQIG